MRRLTRIGKLTRVGEFNRDRAASGIQGAETLPAWLNHWEVGGLIRWAMTMLGQGQVKRLSETGR
ncbi:hypothetical protein IV01_05485 [Pseudomonas syringae]|uniref:Uncharacterized protein n=1 Tax=Pseudomonas syringae TaxID=317 RepID=A0A085VNX3_PSESX|nr:hypothetical protein IV01_05485 [Pseudomonas syringae]